MDELVYAQNFDSPAIEAFVAQAGGDLASVKVNVAGRRYPFAVALLGQTLYYSVSPKIILALLEYQADLVTQPNQPDDRYQWAVGYYGDEGRFAGFGAQIRWAVRELFYARRDVRERPPLRYADGAVLDAPATLSHAQYVLARVLAPTIASGRLDAALAQYQATYERLFGPLPLDIAPFAPPPPFLHRPLAQIMPVTSFFDHGGPFLTRNETDGVTTYWGHTETDIAFAYDGHDGWDYAAAPPDMALAAADGTVVFAGIADDNCDTLAVIIDHGNDVRTLYWHLAQIDVEIGQVVTTGSAVGMIGETGCAKGPHLHFGVQYRGVGIDPYGWCGREPDPWQTHPAGIQSVWLWVDRPSPCAPPPAGSVLVDTDSPGFVVRELPSTAVESGVGNQSLFVASQRGFDRLRSWRPRPIGPVATARWHSDALTPGQYRVFVYVPYALSGLIDADGVYYQVVHRDGIAERFVNMQAVANEWVDLGTYWFAAQGEVVLPLRDAIGGRGVWADAVLWQPETP
jgi:murein DD-endopeptidase MepM/ murein hydrolase activator NlpD